MCQRRRSVWCSRVDGSCWWAALCSCVCAATRQLFLLDWSCIIDILVCLNYVTASYNVAKCLWGSKTDDVILLVCLWKMSMNLLQPLTHILSFPPSSSSPFSFVSPSLALPLPLPLPLFLPFLPSSPSSIIQIVLFTLCLSLSLSGSLALPPSLRLPCLLSLWSVSSLKGG